MAAAALVDGSTVAASASRSQCARAGERVVVSTRQVVVVKVRRRGRVAYIGCLARTGTRRRLDIHRYDTEFDVIKPVGPLVAVYYVETSTDAGGETIEIHNLATGNVLTPYAGSPPGVDFRSIRLRPTGSVAFIYSGGEDQLFVCPIMSCYARFAPLGEPTVLDQGRNIPRSTLRLSGATLSWETDGQPKNAQLQ